MHQEMMPAFGARHRLWMKSPLGGGLTYTTAIIRGTGQEMFDTRDYRHLEILHDHLERALSLHFELKQANAFAARLQAGLDTLANGVVLVDTDGVLVHANRAAHALLAAQDGLRLARGGSIAASNPKAAGKFQAMIAHAAGRLGPAVAGSIGLPRGQGRPLFVRAIPGPPAIRAGENAAAVVLLIRDPEQKLEVAASALSALGLTPAEARLTAALVAGHSVADYATQAGLSPHSVRSLLKTVLAKTGTHRQSELVLLALQVGVLA
jgi:DNA-binding CsgD family transcriptional regulator